MTAFDFVNATLSSTKIAIDVVYHYIDLHYLGWIAWVLAPLAVTFILPGVILLLVYFCGLFLHLYRLRHILKDAYAKDFWNGARNMVCAFWAAQGNLWHGHEIINFDAIPSSGPALIVYYHGAIPIDAYYMMSKAILYRNRRIRGIGDRFMWHIPGFRLILEVMGIQPGTVSSGIQLMKEGHLLMIAPGGVREAYFSDEKYNLIWGKRKGFAKIAMEAQVPVIPMFTQNCREAFRSISLFKDFFRWVYEKTRLPIVPLYGGFPVKLRTYLGKPIHYEPHMSLEDFALQIKDGVETLIKQHQRLPGNILNALSDRIPRGKAESSPHNKSKET